MIMRKISQLKQILKTDGNGRPVLKLKPLKNIAVNTPTKEEYSELMRVYECGGWRWADGSSPTESDDWTRGYAKYAEEMCISVPHLGFDLEFGYADKETYYRIGYKAISPQEFYDKENITPEMLKEINDCFDKSNKDSDINERNFL